MVQCDMTSRVRHLAKRCLKVTSRIPRKNPDTACLHNTRTPDTDYYFRSITSDVNYYVYLLNKERRQWFSGIVGSHPFVKKGSVYFWRCLYGLSASSDHKPGCQGRRLESPFQWTIFPVVSKNKKGDRHSGK